LLQNTCSKKGGERSIVKDEKHTDRSQQKNAKTKRWLGQPQLPMMMNPWILFTSTLYTIVHLCRHSQENQPENPPRDAMDLPVENATAYEEAPHRPNGAPH
jgi:hypothetical protein